MKLATDIIPRADGTVKADAPSGTKYVFKDDGNGLLVADVSNKEDVQFLLDAGFYPADEAGMRAAVAQVGTQSEGSGDDAGSGGAPIEANTPPKPAGSAKKK